VSIYNGDNLPGDIYGQLLGIVWSAFPLNLFWQSSTLTQFDVASTALAIINQFVLDGRAGVVREPSKYAVQFCNPYFASDQPDFYTSAFQPWLAFPFEGVLTRSTNNYFPPSLQVILSAVANSSVEDILNPANSSVSNIKRVFAIGTGYQQNSGAQLFVETFLQNQTVEQVDTSLSVTAALQYVQSTITVTRSSASVPIVNASDVPILIIARYADNPGAFNGYSVPGASTMFFIYTDDNPGNVLNTNLTSVAQLVISGTSARGCVGILDVLEDHGYEDGFGDIYSTEKDVSDAITSMLGTLLSANTQQTSGALLETFAIKNTIVDGQDLGGRLTKQQLLAELSAMGVGLGLKPDAFSMELQESIVQSPNDTGFFGDTAQTTPIPKSVDWFATSPSCTPPVISQGNCENCWAIASSTSLSVRLCLHNGVPIGSALSIQHVTGCAQSVGNNGCEPQPPSMMFTFALGDIHTTICMPEIPTGTQAIGCPTSCQGTVGNLQVVHGIVHNTYAILSGIDTIKRYISQNGPVAAGITIASDFEQVFPVNTPSDAIYNPSQVAYPILGGHMIVVYGYEDNAPVPYWKVRNSWGNTQGQGGNIMIAQNIGAFINHTMWIETNTYVATPRTGSIDPAQPFEVVPGNASTFVTPQSTVYTNTYSCPNVILNQLQNVNATATNGCPSNVAVKNKQRSNAANQQNAANTHNKKNAGVLTSKPSWSLMFIVSSILICCLVV
jgi:hypothetical protein